MIAGELAMVRVTGVDAAPEHVEFTTVIAAVPALAMRMAGTVAVSCVEETKVVASGKPFQFTVAPETKFVPFTVNMNCGPPGVTQVGSIEVIVGLTLMVIISVAVPVPPALVALIVTLETPAVVGVPEITPVLVFTLRPGGSGLAP